MDGFVSLDLQTGVRCGEEGDGMKASLVIANWWG